MKRNACLLLALAVHVVLQSNSSAALVTLNATDAANTSSFNSAGNWSNAQAPSAANDYQVTNPSFTLRTPATTGDFTFAGNSLNITKGNLALKGTTANNTITVPNFFLGAGTVGASSGVTANLAGQITLTGAAVFNGSNNLNITGNLLGTGSASFAATGGSQNTVSGTNTYSGGTTFSAGLLTVASGSSLGSGNVTISATGLTLTLNNTASIAQTATLSLTDATDAVALNYTGTDTIAALSIGGISLPAGTYGGTGSGATVEPEFSGTGEITVVPEPATVQMMLLGGIILAVGLYRSRASKA